MASWTLCLGAHWAARQQGLCPALWQGRAGRGGNGQPGSGRVLGWADPRALATPRSWQVGQYTSVFLDNASGSALTVRGGSHFSAVLLGV